MQNLELKSARTKLSTQIQHPECALDSSGTLIYTAGLLEMHPAAQT
jgi:hypothetical protein